MARTVQPLVSMKNQSRRSATAGFSLVEMLIVVAIIGIIALFAFPRVGDVFNHVNVRGARARIVNTFNSARVLARQNNRVVYFHASGNAVWNAAADGTVMGSVQPIRVTYAVDLTYTRDSIRIDPRGFTGETNTLTVTRSGFADTVIIDGHGRIIR